jgi:hypothetical protein
MKKEFLAIIAGTIFLMAILYWKDNQSNVDQNNSLNSSAKVISASTELAPQEKFIARAASADSTLAKSQSQIAGSDAEVSTHFVATLKTMGQCLQIKNVVDYDQIDPIVSLKPAMGDVTVYTDDWTQADVQYADGSQKRIRTEVNYDNPGNPTKYLQIYKLSEMGVPEMEDLDPQQTTNPSDEYIESMKVGSSTLQHEKGGRAYFQGGEELVIIERNGKIESITMTKNNKTISCNSMSSKESSCQCF